MRKNFMALISVALIIMMMTTHVFAAENMEMQDYETNEIVETNNLGATQTGFGNFEDSYDNMKLTGVDGEVKLYIDDDTEGIVLMKRLVADKGFIDSATKTVYLKRADGKWFWYSYIYQGTTEFKLQEAVVENDEPVILSDNQMKETLGIEEQPTEEQPTEEQPTEEQPTEEQPTEEQPTEEQPTEEQPTEEQPTEEQPTEEQPTEEQPTEEQPTEEQPTEEQPTEEQPTEEQPTEEQPTEEQPENQNEYSIVKIESKYDKILVTIVIDGSERTFTLNTGEYGRIKDFACDEEGTVWILFESNALLAWNARINNEDTFIDVTKECQGIVRAESGFAVKYVANNQTINLPTVVELRSYKFAKMEVYVAREKNDKGFYDLTFIDEHGNRTNKCLSQITKKKYMYDGKIVKGKVFNEISFNKEGDVLARKGKKVYKLVKTSKGKYKFKKYQKKAAELHINPETKIADYIILRNGDKIDCVTKKIYG